MRYGVLADIHGNLHALDAALAVLSRERLDGYICAGDIVGYGPFPNECVERIAELEALAVAGNHDLIALDRLSDDACVPVAIETMRWTKNVLRDDARAYLAQLPLLAGSDGIFVAHGSLRTPTDYITTAEQAARELSLLTASEPDAEILILGHTHRPFMFTPPARRIRVRRRLTVSLVRKPGSPVLMNPGSVGQARERRPWARCMVLDSERNEVVLHALEYDVDACRRALERHGLPPTACHFRPSLWSEARTRASIGRDALRARIRQL